MKRIGFVNYDDPFTDRKAWSGSIFKLREAIENAGFEVKWIPLRKDSIRFLICKIMTKLLHGRGAHMRRTRLYYRMLAQGIDKSALADVDYLFFPGEGAVAHYLKADLPVIYLSDTTFSLMTGYYPGFGEGNQWMIREGNSIEQLGLDASSLIIRSSQWAADSCVNDYHADPSKIFVLEFGPNLDLNDVKPIKVYGGGQTTPSLQRRRMAA